MNEEGRRQARREVIRTMHPDVGGDPEAFIEAMEALARPTPARFVRVSPRRRRWLRSLRKRWRKRHFHRIA